MHVIINRVRLFLARNNHLKVQGGLFGVFDAWIPSRATAV